MREDRIRTLRALINAGNDPDNLIENVYSELEFLAYNEFEEGYDFATETPNLLETDFENKHLAIVSQHLTPEKWLSLSLEPMIGQPSFQYNLSDTANIPFNNASAGQQATAILRSTPSPIRATSDY